MNAGRDYPLDGRGNYAAELSLDVKRCGDGQAGEVSLSKTTRVRGSLFIACPGEKARNGGTKAVELGAA